MEFAGVGITGCYRSPIVDDDGFGYHLLCLPAFVIVLRSTKLPRLISPSWAKEIIENGIDNGVVFDGVLDGCPGGVER